LTIFKYALRRGLLNPASLIVNCSLPLLLIILNVDFDFGGEPNRGLFLVAMLIMYGGFSMARSIQLDKMDGTIIRILAGPISMYSYLVQNFLSAMVPMTVLSVLIGVLGVVLHSWEITFAVALTLCYIFLAASSIGLSFLWSCIFKNKEVSAVALSIFITTIAFVGGLFIPLALLPNPLRLFGALFPAHWAARAMETMISYGMNMNFWLSLLAVSLFTVAYLLYGSKRRII